MSDGRLPSKLVDFAVKLAANGSGYTAFVQQSPAGEGQASFRPPVARTEIDGLRRELSAIVSPRVHREGLSSRARRRAKTMGSDLYRALFADQVGLLLERSLGMLHHRRREGLRINLHVSLDDARVAWLTALPWELVHNGHQFLFLDPRISLTRCLDLPVPAQAAAIDPPLEILVVVATPRDAPAFDARTEYEQLQASFRSSPSIHVAILPRATPEALAHALQQNPVHIVHFVGHARFDTGSGRSFLVFETLDGHANLVNGEDLPQLLNGQITPQLIVLGACETAEFPLGDDGDPWSGVATSLLAAGFPAVVAMQHPITDSAAIAFSRGLYARLAAGDPVDLAMSGGRQAMALARPNSLEWATPVLFLRGVSGQIFRVRKSWLSKGEVVLETSGELSPGDTWSVVDLLTRFLNVSPNDVEVAAGSRRLTISLPASAATSLLEATQHEDQELRQRLGWLSVSSVYAGISRRFKTVVTFFLGVLGNLLAAAIQRSPHEIFTPARILIFVVLLLIFLSSDLLSKIRRRLLPWGSIATIVAGAVLLAAYTVTPLALPKRPCRLASVEIDLSSGPLRLPMNGSHVTTLTPQDLAGVQSLSGRAIGIDNSSECACRWRGRTDLENTLHDIGASGDCAFTVNLPTGYSQIYLELQLATGESPQLFALQAQ